MHPHHPLGVARRGGDRGHQQRGRVRRKDTLLAHDLRQSPVQLPLQLRSLGDLSVSLPSYIETVERKTASLFAASAQCGAIAGGAPPEAVQSLRNFGLAYGIAFQMRDDLLDVTADAASLGKPVGNDLAERKMTIPLILALRSGSREFAGMVERLYAGREPDVAAVIAGIRQSGALDETREKIAEYSRRAENAIDGLENTAAKAELQRLAGELLEEAS